MLSSGVKCCHLELMLSSGTNCYHLGWNVIIWDAMLSSGANVIIWDKMLLCGANVVMLSFGANVIIWCYHVMLSSGMITPSYFIFPENFTHSNEIYESLPTSVIVLSSYRTISLELSNIFWYSKNAVHWLYCWLFIPNLSGTDPFSLGCKCLTPSDIKNKSGADPAFSVVIVFLKLNLESKVQERNSEISNM